MRCKFCFILPVLGVLSAMAVFAAQSAKTTDSSLPAANGLTLANVRGTDAGAPIAEANSESPTAINMHNWQETSRRRGSPRVSGTTGGL
jgi:hypothetical protein